MSANKTPVFSHCSGRSLPGHGITSPLLNQSRLRDHLKLDKAFKNLQEGMLLSSEEGATNLYNEPSLVE